MRSSRIAKIVFSVFLLAPHSALADFVDATGARFAAGGSKPLRIVCLAPSLCELAADLVGDHLSRIVGVTELSDYPAALKKIESVGPYFKLNLEKILSLNPDLVLATMDGNPKDQVTHLRELGVRVMVVDTSHLNDIPKSIRWSAEALEEKVEGERIATRLEKFLTGARERAKSRKPRKVLIQVGYDPLVVAGKETFLSEAAALLGAQNVYGDLRGRYPRPSNEDLVSKDPDVILILAMGTETKGAMAFWKKRFPKLRAVQLNQLIILNSDELLRPSVRLPYGLAQMERAIYGP